MSNKEISEKLGVPVTKVEHWSRTDDGFAVPDENIWFCLKNLLKIDSDEYFHTIISVTKDNLIVEI